MGKTYLGIKQPYETYKIKIDLTEFLGQESLGGYKISVYDLKGTEIHSMLEDATYTSGTLVLTIGGGKDGRSYKITVKGYTSSSPARKFEEDIFLTVKDY